MFSGHFLHHYHQNHHYHHHNYHLTIIVIVGTFSVIRAKHCFVGTTGFLRAFWIFQKKLRFGFLDFLIFGFLDFFGFLAISRQRKELQVTFWCQNDRIFEGFLDFPKKWRFGFLDFWISGFVETGADVQWNTDMCRAALFIQQHV